MRCAFVSLLTKPTSGWSATASPSRRMQLPAARCQSGSIPWKQRSRASCLSERQTPADTLEPLHMLTVVCLLFCSRCCNYDKRHKQLKKSFSKAKLVFLMGQFFCCCFFVTGAQSDHHHHQKSDTQKAETTLVYFPPHIQIIAVICIY